MARRTAGSVDNVAKLRDKYEKILSKRSEELGRKLWEMPSRLGPRRVSKSELPKDKVSPSSLPSKEVPLREKIISHKKPSSVKINLLPPIRSSRLKKRSSLPDLLKSAIKKGKSSKEREEAIDIEEFQNGNESQILDHQRATDIMEEVFQEAAQPQSASLDKVVELEKRFSSLREIVTRNSDLMELKYKISEVAKFNTDVLILGETGTGKELFAHAIHQMSGRQGNFAPINCSAIPKDLFESELFGHKKGAFSGAFYDKKGAFEYANQGTLFLDEIGEMPLEMQAKILRVVEYRTINRLGSTNPIPLDLRIVFATNRDLKKEVDERRFRKDLFFRIFSPSFRIIPLRERIEDIPVLVEHFLNTCNEKFQKKVESISPELMKTFRRYTWDGNVRELMKVIEMGVINSMGSRITEKEIPYFTDDMLKEQESTDDQDLPPASKITDEDIKYWMEKLNHNKSKVARRLGVSYRTILRRSKDIYQ